MTEIKFLFHRNQNLVNTTYSESWILVIFEILARRVYINRQNTGTLAIRTRWTLGPASLREMAPRRLHSVWDSLLTVRSNIRGDPACRLRMLGFSADLSFLFGTWLLPGDHLCKYYIMWYCRWLLYRVVSLMDNTFQNLAGTWSTILSLECIKPKLKPQRPLCEDELR